MFHVELSPFPGGVELDVTRGKIDAPVDDYGLIPRAGAFAPRSSPNPPIFRLRYL
jgi:hypothetical protein